MNVVARSKLTPNMAVNRRGVVGLGGRLPFALSAIGGAMPFTAIVRVSFQSSVQANQATNSALVGHAQNTTGPGPFARVGTAVFTVTQGNDAAVGQALASLGQAVATYSGTLDFLSVSLVRT